MRFADLTTFRIGGDIRRFIDGTSEEVILKTLAVTDSDLIEVIGGGSNLLAGDDAFEGTVLRISNVGSELDYDSCSGGMITVAAGVDWDQFVAQTVRSGFSGLETLSGIPGRVGAAPIQNIGAYGQEVRNVIARVRTWDRQLRQQQTFTANQCGFGYRSSLFKENPSRFVILDVTFQLKKGELSIPITYPELARELGISEGERTSVPVVRQKVLEIRKRKGMLLSTEDSDTWSAGSFFINPSVSAEMISQLPATAPRWPNGDGTFKTSAAWLLENAGITKGQRVGGARISTKHVLALSNVDHAKTREVLELAKICQAAVREKFGIKLEPEVRLINCSL